MPAGNLKESHFFSRTDQKVEYALGGFIARSLGDVDYALINGNFAMEAGLKATDALAIEDKDSLVAQTFANVVVVKEGDENKEVILALKEALNSEQIKKFIEEKYQGSVMPVFG